MKRNMKLILATLLAAVMLLGMAAPALASSKEYVQATEEVNIRKGPGTNYARVGWLQAGTIVERAGKSGNWTRISLGDGRYGYVHTSYLRSVTSVNTSYVGKGIVFIDEDDAAASGTRYYATTNLNLRKGPGTNYERIGWLEKGESVTVISVDGKWAQVDWNGVRCYAFFQYLSPAWGSSSSAVGTWYYATTNLNLRKGPGTSYERIGSLAKGESVMVISVDGKWAKVNWNGTECYAFFSYLKKGTGTTVRYDVATESVYAYYGPGTSYKQAGVVSKGTRLNVLGTVGTWTMIEWDGMTAYIPTKYVGTAGETPGVTVAGYYTTTRNVTAYRGPGTSYSAAGTFLKGVRLQVVARTGDWAIINFDGQALYVESRYLVLDKADSSGGWNDNWNSSSNSGWGNSWQITTDTADGTLASFVKDNRNVSGYDFKNLKTIYVADPPTDFNFTTDDFSFNGSSSMTVVFRNEDDPSETARFIWYREPGSRQHNYRYWDSFTDYSNREYYYREHEDLGYSEAYWWYANQLFYARVPYYFNTSKAVQFFRSVHDVPVD